MESTGNSAGNLNVSGTTPGPTKEVIAKLARIIWEKAGQPAGHDQEFWLMAEAVLKEQAQPAAHTPLP